MFDESIDSRVVAMYHCSIAIEIFVVDLCGIICFYAGDWRLRQVFLLPQLFCIYFRKKAIVYFQYMSIVAQMKERDELYFCSVTKASCLIFFERQEQIFL